MIPDNPTERRRRLARFGAQAVGNPVHKQRSNGGETCRLRLSDASREPATGAASDNRGPKPTAPVSSSTNNPPAKTSGKPPRRPKSSD